MILQNDASKKGLGAVLLQNSKPVMFASRTLTGSERNYQNLERKRGRVPCNHLRHGKEFTLETDQKPLVSINKKHMVKISQRIQRLIVRSFPYQPFKVQYSKDVEIPLVDVPKSCYTVTNGRGWNSAANHSSQCGDSKHSIHLQRIG